MGYDTYEMVTDKILAALEQGMIPWAQPWASVMDCAWSGVTGRPYSFCNQMLLLPWGTGKTMEQMRDDVRGEWLTFKQALERGGCVRKGEHGRRVVFFKQVQAKTKDGEFDPDNPKMFPLLMSYVVFHIRQCDGVEQKYHVDEEQTFEFSPIERAEEVVRDYLARSGVGLRHESGNRAFYRPKLDVVTLPMREQFSSVPEYYSTLFHELAHSTGNAKRLDRELTPLIMDKESYSTEELVAEIASASIMATLGIDTDGTLRNSTAYIQGWLKALKNDKRMVVVASARAEKAVRLILGLEA